jgi:glycosyltransferase involved in cell wall biosynthesis
MLSVCIDYRPAQATSATGTATYVSRLATALSNRPDLDISWLAWRERSAALPEVLREARVLWLDEPPRPRRWHPIWDLIRVPPLLRRHPVDVFHATTPTLVKPPRGIRLVSTILDLIPLLYPQDFVTSWDGRVLFRRRIRHSLTSDHIVSISDATKRAMVELFNVNPDRILTTPLAPSQQFHPQATGAAESFLKSKGLAPGYVLYLGGYSRRKNVPVVLAAFARAAATTGTLHLVLAGKVAAEGQRALTDIANDLGIADRIRWIGEVGETDLPLLYACAGAFVYPSQYEGFGLPVIEAMACGVPVVAGSGGAMAEVAGDGAVILDSFDIEGFATALVALLTKKELAAHYRAKGIARARAFSWNKTAAATVDAYKAALR